EAAAEAEAQPLAVLGGVAEAGVVELQPGQRLAQRLELVVVYRVQAAEAHRLRLLVARQGFGRWPQRVRHRVADVNVANGLDLGHEVADLPARQLSARGHRRPELADL